MSGVTFRSGADAAANSAMTGAWRRSFNSHRHRRHSFASSRRVSPELCLVVSPSNERGRREDRVPAGHPRSTVRKVATEFAQRHTGEAKHPAFPAQWFYGLCRALLGERCTIAPVALQMADARVRLDPTHHRNTWRTDPGRQDHTILPYARSHRSCVRCASLTVSRPAITVAPVWPTSTAVRPAFVTIAIRPSSLGRSGGYIRRFRISVKWNILRCTRCPTTGVFCPSATQGLVFQQARARATPPTTIAPHRSGAAPALSGLRRRRDRPCCRQAADRCACD